MNILVIGAGDIGFHLCERLSAEKHDITIIESDSERVENAREHLDAQIIEGSGTSSSTLRKAQIEDIDIVAELTNNDEVNIVACKIAKKMGVHTTILRVRSHEFLSGDCILSKEELGADFVIQPEMQTANAIVQLVRQANATDVIEFENGRIQLIGIRLDSNATILKTPLFKLGREFGNLPLRILAIKRKQFTIIPQGEDMLFEGDQIYIICDQNYLTDALNFFGKTDTEIENIMIIGGGLIGEFVAKQLENEVSVKIIEDNQIKSEQLAEELSNSLVIKGDGSDLDLLTFEGLQDMDEFIAVSGDDETNIITSLVAHHLNVPRTITLVRKLDYLSLTHAIGIDAIISKQMITVNAIKQIIRRGDLALFAELPGIDAEIVEFIANGNSKITKKPLRDIDFPKAAIVGAVMKNSDVIEIPRGDTHIQQGDRVIIFSHPKSLKDVEKLF